MILPQYYREKVQSRSKTAFIKGLLIRIPIFIKYSLFRWYARQKGAIIGDGTILHWKLARKANRNLIIGEDCAINTHKIDLRSKVIIGNHVIINDDVEIIRVSHYIDDDRTFKTRFYSDLVIGDYSWVATGAKIIPQVAKITKGSVCGAFSVIVKDTEANGIYGGNPAKLLKHRNCLHDSIVVAALQGGDLIHYINARKKH